MVLFVHQPKDLEVSMEACGLNVCKIRRQYVGPLCCIYIKERIQ